MSVVVVLVFQAFAFFLLVSICFGTFAGSPLRDYLYRLVVFLFKINEFVAGEAIYAIVFVILCLLVLDRVLGLWVPFSI